jgi:uncharacterized membrane protein YccF (DUF307 family)
LWLLAGVLMMLSIIGIPWAYSAFVIAGFVAWPFGREPVSRHVVTGRDDVGTGTLGVIGNVIWVLFFGITLFIAHLAQAIACAITIIGIPFAIQHLKIAKITIWPIGQTIVEIED